MSVINYDCGEMSDVVISSNNFTGVINITSNAVNGDVAITNGMNPLSFLCSGSMDIDSPLNSVHVFLSNVSLAGALSENILMGFAGLVCGALFGYAVLKAV